LRFPTVDSYSLHSWFPVGYVTTTGYHGFLRYTPVAIYAVCYAVPHYATFTVGSPHLLCSGLPCHIPGYGPHLVAFFTTAFPTFVRFTAHTFVCHTAFCAFAVCYPRLPCLLFHRANTHTARLHWVYAVARSPHTRLHGLLRLGWFLYMPVTFLHTFGCPAHWFTRTVYHTHTFWFTVAYRLFTCPTYHLLPVRVYGLVPAHRLPHYAHYTLATVRTCCQFRAPHGCPHYLWVLIRLLPHSRFVHTVHIWHTFTVWDRCGLLDPVPGSTHGLRLHLLPALWTFACYVVRLLDVAFTLYLHCWSFVGV